MKRSRDRLCHARFRLHSHHAPFVDLLVAESCPPHRLWLVGEASLLLDGAIEMSTSKSDCGESSV
jgi:hypothetical protein